MKINYGNDEQNFVESKLIAYIGNKRRLIKLIVDAFKHCNINQHNDNNPPTFFDPFAGTGVVSRLAKTQGFRVFSNDWEYYSFVINKLYIEMDDDDIKSLFKSMGGIENVVDMLNELPPLPKDKTYIAKYYCPKSTKEPDIINERMFYTRETGEKIDAIREEIENIKKSEPNPKKAEKKLYALLPLLLYEVSARSNTSGVFKAFHKGFGGSRGDALSRILRKLVIEKPILWKNITKHKVFNDDAVELCKRLKHRIRFDITYLDPPYNQHQYGSNYHMLNTVAYNDKPEINKEIYINGKKTNKSGIRKDWKRTKSGFCYKSSAKLLFKELIRNINSKYILVSYSIDGIIPFDDMMDILVEKGALDIITSQYVKYPGGKQSLKRDTNNIEFVLIVNTDKKGHIKHKKKVYGRLLDEKIPLYLSKTVSEDMLINLGYVLHSDNEFIKSYIKDYHGYSIKMDIQNGYSIYQNGDTIQYKNIVGEVVELGELPLNIKEEYLNDLKNSCDLTKEDELNMILGIIKKNHHKGYYDIVYKYLPKIPHLLNKFNNRKAYEASLEMVLKITDTFKEINITELEDKKVITTIKRLNTVIENKLKIKNNTKRINDLKKLIRKEYYTKIAEKYLMLM